MMGAIVNIYLGMKWNWNEMEQGVVVEFGIKKQSKRLS